jgi:hypothetical protein
MRTMIPNIKIGVLQSGKIINEVLVNDTKDVSIGTSLDNTIMVNKEGFEETFCILSYFDGRYYLRLHSGISGKVFEGTRSINVSELVKHPDIIHKGEGFFYPLSNETRGMLLLGKETILFKVYPGEPIPEKLPKEFQGALFGGYFETSFFLIFLFFLIGYIFLVYSFNQVRPTANINFEKIPERFARLIMDVPYPIKKKDEGSLKQSAENKEQQKNTTEENKNKNITKKNVSKKNTARIGGGNTEDNRDASEIVRSAGIIGVIGSKGKGGNVSDLFQEQGFNTKLDKALKGVSGLYAGTSIKDARMKRGAGDAAGIEIGSLKATTGSGAMAFDPQNADAKNTLGEIGSRNIEGSGYINPSMIAKALAQHIGAFQYCYNKALQVNPRLKGELKVRFTILSGGMSDKDRISFSGPAAKDNNLTSCLYRVFLRVKFPSPKGGEVTVNYPMSFTSHN